MRKSIFNLHCFLLLLFGILLIGIFSCKDPANDITSPNNPDTPSSKTYIEFKNLEQFPVTIYRDPGRNDEVVKIEPECSKTIPFEPAPMGIAFYPTFTLLYPVGTPVINTISIPYNAPSLAHTVNVNTTTILPIPKLKSIYINSSYLLINNKSAHSLSLRKGPGPEEPPLDGGSTIINSDQNAAFSVNPGSVSNYRVMVNTMMPIDFPKDFLEFKQGIIHVLTYDGISLSLTDKKSVLGNIPPAIPENVQAVPISKDSVRITWNEVYGSTSYLIYRATNSAGFPYSLVASTTEFSWTDSDLAIGEINCYKVSALSLIEGKQSEAVLGVMPPANVRVYTVSSTSIGLAWDAVNGVGGYNVYRSNFEGGTYNKVNSVAVNETVFTDTDVTASTTYYYKINAVSGDIESSKSYIISIVTPDIINTNYTPTLTLANLPLPTGYTWNEPTTGLNAGNGQSFLVTYIDPSGNYGAANGTIIVNVAKAPGIFGSPVLITTTYTPTLILANLALPTGYTWNDPATKLNAGNRQSFLATFTDPSGNYEATNGTITINIAKADGAIVTPPTLNSKTHNSITVTSATVQTGQLIEYAISVNSMMPSSGWQFSTTFTGLSSGTSYYLFARTSENNNYNTGVVSSSLTVVTLQPTPKNRFEYFWVDQHDSLVTSSDGVVTVYANETLTITAQDTGYLVRQWYLDGINTGQNGIAYNFTSTITGKHTVGLFVEKDGKLYNTNITITVQ
jgi:hypothetical protein